MKCPHCNSHMDNYQSSADDKCQVLFYRCTICEAQHVSSSKVTTYQLESTHHSTQLFSRNRSQTSTPLSV